MAAPSSRGVARARLLIIAGVVALGVWLYLRNRKASDQTAAAAGSTNPQPSVPSYQLSGTYDGPYTPYNIITNGVQQPAGAMPGGALGGTVINSTAPVTNTTNVPAPQA